MSSLCPLNASVPIIANGIIPIAQSEVSTIPSLAYSIPDFEGQAILRIFANSTESEIACYSAVVTNGHSFSHPNSVGTVLGICAAVTMIASFATAIYGEAVPTMRLHYAHSLSVGVVFAVYQHIFFTGALSVNWPAVLVAWWSNFAWSGGMIYSGTMQHSINTLIGNVIGNTSQVGAAPVGSTQDDLGGGYNIQQIYGRSLAAIKSSAGALSDHPLRRDLKDEIFSPNTHDMFRRDMIERAIYARQALANKSDGYSWYGRPVGPGLPLPGNYSGFAGTLATQNIRVSNAFMTGFLWLLILLALVTFAVIAFKWTLEGLSLIKLIKQDRLKFFRSHWRRYTTAVALRTCYIGFFMMMFLTIFEFTYTSSAPVKVVAAVVFVIFFVGMTGAAAYAVYYKKHFTGKDRAPRVAQVEHKKLLGIIPIATSKNVAQAGTGETERVPDSKSSSKPFWKRKNSLSSLNISVDDVDNIHDYDDYTMKFGWLVSRFRRTRWYFFTLWICYEFLRAVFYGGASGYALAQVFGLLIIEFLAFVYVIWARPFEGRRLNVIVVYCLGFSKVASVALSAAFDVNFNLARITTTVIGIVIIVIQGILTVVTMIAVVVGAISSYMSVSRNHEDFRPRKWHNIREKYFNHLDRVVNDLPREKKPKVVPQVAQAEAVEPTGGFEMRGMKRLAKIEDEDEEFASEMRTEDPNASYLSLGNRAPSANASDAALNRPRSGAASPVARSRAASMHSQSNLPYGARAHRPSWNTRDFSPAGAEDTGKSFTSIDMSQSVPDDAPTPIRAAGKGSRHSRSTSLTSVFGKSAPAAAAIKPQSSVDELRVGGDISTRDMIGKVPAPPPIRPRSSTHGSARNSRSGTPVNGLEFADGFEGQPGSQRNSRFPLTPALEKDEWGTPKTSQEDKE